jgi:hypothetical protein
VRIAAAAIALDTSTYAAADAPVRMAAQRREGSPQPHGA